MYILYFNKFLVDLMKITSVIHTYYKTEISSFPIETVTQLNWMHTRKIFLIYVKQYSYLSSWKLIK